MIIEYADQLIEVKSDGLFYWKDTVSETLQSIKDFIDKTVTRTPVCKALWLQGYAADNTETVEIVDSGQLTTVNSVLVRLDKKIYTAFLDQLFSYTPENEALLEQMRNCLKKEKDASDERIRLKSRLERLDLS